MDELTQEILATLRTGLSGQNSLFFASVDGFVERSVYLYVSDIIEKESNTDVVWLCLSSPRDKILAKFEDFGYDISDFVGRLHCIVIHPLTIQKWHPISPICSLQTQIHCFLSII